MRLLRCPPEGSVCLRSEVLVPLLPLPIGRKGVPEMQAQPGPDRVSFIRKHDSAIMMSGRGTLFVHKVCRSQLVKVEGGRPFCEVCDRFVEPDEIEEVDNSPSPFSG